MVCTYTQAEKKSSQLQRWMHEVCGPGAKTKYYQHWHCELISFRILGDDADQK